VLRHHEVHARGDGQAESGEVLGIDHVGGLVDPAPPRLFGPRLHATSAREVLRGGPHASVVVAANGGLEHRPHEAQVAAEAPATLHRPDLGAGEVRHRPAVEIEAHGSALPAGVAGSLIHELRRAGRREGHLRRQLRRALHHLARSVLLVCGDDEGKPRGLGRLPQRGNQLRGVRGRDALVEHEPSHAGAGEIKRLVPITAIAVHGWEHQLGDLRPERHPAECFRHAEIPFQPAGAVR